MGRGPLTTSTTPPPGGRGPLTTSTTPPPGKGWKPDLPDNRDYDEEHELVKKSLAKAGLKKGSSKKLPANTDLRKWCSPIENQGSLNSCSAHATVGLMEYLMRRATGKHVDGSRLFVYKVSLNLLKSQYDDGAYLRTAIGAVAFFGMPPEDYWPYDENRLSEEPTPFCYAFADAFKAAKYYRLDGVDVTKKALLEKIKSHLAAELPVIFGFTTFGSMDHPDNQPGYIPFPDPSEKSKEGHAVMAVGYDDKKEIINPLNHKKTTGALLIRNSWGTAWGDKGYGWLPYDYVLKELAMDWWCIIREDWVDPNKFNQ